MKRTTMFVAAMMSITTSGGAYADGFVASPQDYPDAETWAAAYAAALAEAKAGELDGIAYSKGVYQFKEGVTPVMTPIQRRVFLDLNGTGNDHSNN